MFRNEEGSGCSGFSLCGPNVGGPSSSSSSSSLSEGPKQRKPKSSNSKTGCQYEDWTDAELAKEMYELSVQEREKILDDIHGVAQAQEETPEFVARCLEDLDKAISLLSKGKRKSLDRAIFQSPSLQHDAKFKLMFLRSDAYNPRRAADRMANYYTNKQKLFGEEKLVKKITLDDLTEQDMQLFRADCLLELPHRDQTGRPVWFFDMGKIDYESLTSLVSKVMRMRIRIVPSLFVFLIDCHAVPHNAIHSFILYCYYYYFI
jgi:hypothetical protein